MYIITVKIHIDQVLYFWGFCSGRILSRHQFYLLFIWSNTANTQYKANHVLGRFCPREDFIPGRIQSFALSLHYGKHSSRSSFVFSGLFAVGGFCPNKNSTLSYVYNYSKHSYGSSFVFGGFCPGGILSQQQLYSMYSITVNIHIDQHMFWEEFVLGRILSREGLSSLL